MDTCIFSKNKTTRHTLVSAQGTLFHSVLGENFWYKPYKLYLCIFMTMQIIPFTLLNQFWRIWHKIIFGGGVWTLKRVVIGSDGNILLRVQMVWQRTGLFELAALILTHFSWLGSFLSTIEDVFGQQGTDSYCTPLALSTDVWCRGKGIG